jgi:hypothetical protein
MAPGPWITRDLKECVRASDYDALAAERDALRKDAERYRWLRDSAGNDIMEKLMAECSPPRWDELVDAAIDAAMGERP